MAQRITVADLVAEVRQQLDEVNNEAIGDQDDILPALNRAQNYAADVLSRHYKEPLLTSAAVTSSNGEFPIPESAFEDRLLKVEALPNGSAANGTYWEVPFLSYDDWDDISNNATLSIPLGYTVVGRTVKLLPPSSSTTNYRIWYLQDPMPLDIPQGRINLINAASNYVILDSVGSAITAVSDDLDSFLNIVDGATGLVKGTLQVQSVAGSTVTFKTVPTRTTVYDLTVDDTLVGLGISVDDYVCSAPSTCVPFLKKPLANFLVQYAVAELTRKLGGDTQAEQAVLANFEKQVERTWARRPNNMQVKRRSPVWARTTRRGLWSGRY